MPLSTQRVIGVLKRAGFAKAIMLQDRETLARRCPQGGFVAWKSCSVVGPGKNIPFIAVEPRFGDDHVCASESDCDSQFQALLRGYCAALQHEGLAVSYSRDRRCLHVAMEEAP